MNCVNRERMSENRFVMRIFGPKMKKDGTTQSTKLITKAILVLCPLTNIRVLNPWRRRWAGHVASVGEGGYAYRTFNTKT